MPFLPEKSGTRDLGSEGTAPRGDEKIKNYKKIQTMGIF
jgi:hypothetical protein